MPPSTSTTSKPKITTKKVTVTKSSAPSSSKYEKAAKKNLQTFTVAVVGKGGRGNEEEEEMDRYSSSSDPYAEVISSDEDENEHEKDALELAEEKLAKGIAEGKGKGKAKVEKKESKPKAKKESTKSKSTFKSTEFILDSDDSDEVLGERVEEGGAGASPKKGKGKGKEATAPKKRASKATTSTKKEKKPRPPPAPKEGDAPKGTEAEETRITSLKSLLKLSGTLRPFNNATGAERTLAVEERLAILEDLLIGLELLSKRGAGLPSVGKAKEVGEKRALAEEMKAISGAPVFETLRDGKKRKSTGDSELESGSGSEEGRQGGAGGVGSIKKPKFGAFLGQSSSDSE